MGHQEIQELKARKVEQELQAHPALREIQDSQERLVPTELSDNREQREHQEILARSEFPVCPVRTETLAPLDNQAPPERRELPVMPDLSVIPGRRVEVDPLVQLAFLELVELSEPPGDQDLKDLVAHQVAKGQQVQVDRQGRRARWVRAEVSVQLDHQVLPD